MNPLKRVPRPAVLLLAAALLAPAAACAQAGSESGDVVRRELLRRLNRERERAGAPPLRHSGPLTQVAQEHAEELSRSGSLSFPPGTQETLRKGMERAGYEPHAWSENVAMNTGGLDAVVADWQEKDRSSFDRLMDPEVRDLGVGLSRLRDAPLYTFLYAVPRGERFERSTAELRDLERVRREMLAAVNRVRREAGLRPLGPDPKLDRAAQRHAEDLLARGYFSHVSPDGENVSDRISATGYRWSTVGENIAEGQLSVAEVMRRWLESPSHRRNLLSPDFRELGAGLALGRSGGRYRVVWTQAFATPARGAR